MNRLIGCYLHTILMSYYYLLSEELPGDVRVSEERQARGGQPAANGQRAGV